MTEDIRYNESIQQTLCEVMNEERNSIRREKNRARLTQYIRCCGLNEDLLDDIEAVDKTASSKIVADIDIDNESRISPAKEEKHDLLFRIKYDPYRFTNSMNEFFSATNRNRTIDMSKDELDELNAFVRDIKERIYILGENARFIDEMSEVLFVCGNKLTVDYLSEFSDEN